MRSPCRRPRPSVCFLVLLSGCAVHGAAPGGDPSSLLDAASSWERAIERKDPAAIAEAFTENAIAMYPQPMPTVGRENNRLAWESVFSDPAVEHPVTVDSVRTAASDDLGYTFGRWWYRHPARKVSSGGRYLAVWKRDGGIWRITILSANRHTDVAADTITR